MLPIFSRATAAVKAPPAPDENVLHDLARGEAEPLPVEDDLVDELELLGRWALIYEFWRALDPALNLALQALVLHICRHDIFIVKYMPF